MPDHDHTSPLDEYDLDDTISRQIATSGMTGIVRELRRQAGDDVATDDDPEKDES